MRNEDDEYFVRFKYADLEFKVVSKVTVGFFA